MFFAQRLGEKARLVGSMACMGKASIPRVELDGKTKTTTTNDDDEGTDWGISSAVRLEERKKYHLLCFLTLFLIRLSSILMSGLATMRLCCVTEEGRRGGEGRINPSFERFPAVLPQRHHPSPPCNGPSHHLHSGATPIWLDRYEKRSRSWMVLTG